MFVGSENVKRSMPSSFIKRDEEPMINLDACERKNIFRIIIVDIVVHNYY